MVTGSLEKIRSALEAAGITGPLADSIVKDAASDHGFFGAEEESIANSRANGYMRQLRDEGVSLGFAAAVTIEGEIARYFMSE